MKVWHSKRKERERERKRKKERDELKKKSIQVKRRQVSRNRSEAAVVFGEFMTSKSIKFIAKTVDRKKYRNRLLVQFIRKAPAKHAAYQKEMNQI